MIEAFSKGFYLADCDFGTGDFDVHGIIIVCAGITVEGHDEGGKRAQGGVERWKF